MDMTLGTISDSGCLRGMRLSTLVLSLKTMFWEHMVFRKQCVYSPFAVEFKPSASPRRKTQDAQILGCALMHNVVRCFYQNRNIHIVSSFRRKWVSYEQWVSCVVIHILCVSLEVIDFLHRKICGHGRNLHVISGNCELWARLLWFFFFFFKATELFL